MSMAVNDKDQSYSHVGQFAQERKIFGHKADFMAPIWDAAQKDWFHRLMIQMHVSFTPEKPEGTWQGLSQWRADRFASMQKALRLGHPKSAILCVWMDSLLTPHTFWRPGMALDNRQPLTEGELEAWLRGGRLHGQG